jgi:rSAM/selenodomain-associated transferase 2
MLSIIIPVLNEASNITRLLDHLIESAGHVVPMEMIIVDGGSTDGSVQLVEQFASKNGAIPIAVITAPKGRALQMNKGAAIAKGSILYFLHADSFPPKGYDDLILVAVSNGKEAGCFRMKFDTGHWILRCSQWFTRFNVKACRGGDQSLFVLRSVFDHLSGYDENYMVYEDCEFIGRLYDTVDFTVINDYVITSARRYDTNGTLRLQYHFAVIHIKKWFGANATELSNYYNKHILS